MPLNHVAIETGTKGKKHVASAIAWPGWERNGKSEAEALVTLEAYRSRYAPVAEIAGLRAEFDATGGLEVVDRYVGTGTTDFWGITTRVPVSEQGKISEEECERRIAILEACWVFFDNVFSRVSAELRKGPRGGGRDRNEILHHTYGTERTQWAPKVGVNTPQGAMLTPDGLRLHRQQFADAIRTYNQEGRKARTWPLQLLLKRTCYHMLDHAWEMGDKNLSGECGSSSQEVR
ncbi:MAG TPA: hypothetical protein VD789_08950 [Thermomicrobiales bacterium]|nr:hypothetical protein [Thermomicrobiales bacterium]